MYRLLIVDDEEIITESMYEVFSQLMPEQLDICKAFSGKEALSWLSRTRIDIVITDIRMPGMSGLELSEKIRTYWPRCRIIILTGYSEFEYAYQAIQMSKVKYLLKSEGYAKVIETVLEVIEEIKHDLQVSHLLKQNKEQSYWTSMLVTEEYLRYLINFNGRMKGKLLHIEEDFNAFHIPFHAKSGVILVLGRPSAISITSFSEQIELMQSIRNIWNSFMLTAVNHLGITDRYGDLLWFVQPSHLENDKFVDHYITYIEGNLELIQQACQQSLGATISFTMSGIECGWNEVADQYDRLRQLQQSRLSSLPSIQIDAQDFSLDIEQKSSVRLTRKLELLNNYLETGRNQDFFQCFNDILNIVLNESISLEKMQESYYSIALMLLTYVNKQGISDELPDAQKLMRIELHHSLEEGFTFLYRFSNILFQFTRVNERDRALVVTDQICKFIEEHLEEDLSLVRLAEIYHFNSSYLSRFFKQELGMNVSEYIDVCRSKKAKELLLDGNLKIREVAVRVGYEAPNSFTRFFKKTTGMTPQEYRDTYLTNT